MWASEDIVHVASSARHLFGKPCHAAALPAQLLSNQMAKMDVGHILSLFFRRLPSAVASTKKNVGILLLAPTVRGLRITFYCKIEQREAHVEYVEWNQ